MYGYLQIWNISSIVQLDISLVRCAHLDTQSQEKFCIYAPMYYSLFIFSSTVLSEIILFESISHFEYFTVV